MVGTRWLPKRLQQSPSHERAKHQEQEAAGRIGGKTVKGSGSGNEKGDARAYKLARVECKTTKNKSFSVTTETIAKLEDAVAGADEVPVLEVELELGKHRVYVVPAWAMEMMLNAS